MVDIDPSDHTIAELEEELAALEDADDLAAIRDAEADGKDRKGAKSAIASRLDELEAAADDGEEADSGDADGEEAEDEEPEEDEEAEEDEEEEPEEDDGLDHPTADKRHVRALTGGDYRDMWVYCETQQGELIDVSREMLGKARELMDDYAEEYGDDERVVAVLIGDEMADLTEECIALGADLVVYQEDERLDRFRHKPYTEIFCDMARAGSDAHGTDPVDWKDYDEPRYALFPATNNGRDISALVQAELDSGLASDCSGLSITDELISNPVKTGNPGEKVTFERILHMKRPDFSGFEYSTILCIDNPDRDFHPQGGSVIPGSFPVPEPDPEREGEVVEYDADLDDDWFRVAVTEHDQLEAGVDLTDHEVVVCMGRGISDDPTRGMELGLELTNRFDDAALGVTRGIVTASYDVAGHVEQYTAEERQIGETGQVVKPPLYVAAGVSGAVQHKVGMDGSETIVAINTDPDARIRDFSDYFIEGDLFDVLPRLIDALETGELDLQAIADGGS